jgi:ABC-2 type transport system permease protein
MNDRAVKGLAVNFKHIWIAKSLTGIKYLVISCFLLFAGYVLFTVAPNDVRIIPIAFTDALSSIFVIMITYLWQVPLFLFLGYKTGIFLSITSSLLFNTIIGPVIAAKSYWFICPFSYPARLVCPILKIMPNGLLLKPENPSFTDLASYTVVPIGILLSVILLISLLLTTARWYQNKEVK